MHFYHFPARRNLVGIAATVALILIAPQTVLAATYTAYDTNTLKLSSDTYSSAFGYYALYDNTRGAYNMANGAQALFGNTTCYQNTVSGVNTFYANTIGFNNAAYGSQALYANTSGPYNWYRRK
jgi:hypothetical protein